MLRPTVASMAGLGFVGAGTFLQLWSLWRGGSSTIPSPCLRFASCWLGDAGAARI